MKKNIILILQVILWLIFPLVLYIAFIDRNIWNLEIYFIIPYLLFRIIPSFFYKKVNYLFIKLTILNIIIFSFLIYFLSLYSDNLSSYHIKIESDERSYLANQQIKEIISYKSLKDINNIQYFEKYGIYPISNCYFFTKIGDNKWYIYAYKYESKKNININNKEYFIYKSIDNYKISNELMKEIVKITNEYCWKKLIPKVN